MGYLKQNQQIAVNNTNSGEHGLTTGELFEEGHRVTFLRNAAGQFSIQDSITTQVTYDSVLLDTDNGADLVNKQIIIPNDANWVKLSAHFAFPTPSVTTGINSILLFRKVLQADLTVYGQRVYLNTGDLYNPSGANPIFGTLAFTPEANYRITLPYSTANALYAYSPWIPVMAVGESWGMFVYQTSTAAITTAAGPSAWLCAEYK